MTDSEDRRPPVGREKLTAAGAAQYALSAREGGEPVVLVTVVAAPDDGFLGRRMAVTREAREGSLGAEELDRVAESLARKALDLAEPFSREVEGPGGDWLLYLEPHAAAPELLIVGAGHIARPLARLGAMLGYRVTVMDDRPEFASVEWFPDADRVLVIDYEDPFRDVAIGAGSFIVLVTRGHKYDYDCVRRLLQLDAKPAYLGMIGSRRRVRAAFEALIADGIDPERLSDVHAPIGLDIGAETPEEIAVAIAAEIVAVRRGGSGAMLGARERLAERLSRRQE